jgi:hypothetical protein
VAGTLASPGVLGGLPAPAQSPLSPHHYFNLPLRAAAAIHCLTNLVDERQKELPYFDVKYDARPVTAVHIRWDYGDGVGRYVDALCLARIMSRSEENRHVDAALEKWLLGMLGEHGLSWWPEPPYRSPHPAGQKGRMADVTWTQRSTLSALTTLHALTGEPRYAAYGRRLIDGLSQLVLWNDGMAYFPEEATRTRAGDVLYRPGGWSSQRMLTAGWFGAILGALISPLARFASVTGYEPAVRLGRGLTEFALRGAEVFHPDGRFRDLLQGHFYARVTTANGFLRLGILTGRRPYVDMAERIYGHAKEWGTSFGWFPEDLSVPGSETCCIKEMIELAIGLAMHVDPRYWDDVERFGRNHLLESQLLRTDWIDHYHSPKPYTLPVEDPSRISRERVMERWRGGFAGWSGVNDWVFPGKGGMACCNASGARALYDLWHYGVSRRDGEVSINLLLSRASADVILKSHLPYAGCVEIQRRTEDPIRMRIPEYVQRASLTVEKNGETSTARRAGPWLLAPQGKAGDVIVVRFQLPERVERVHLGYQSYEVHYKGDTVTAVAPRGTVCPLYERGWAAGSNPSIADPVDLPGTAKEIESI